MPEYRLIKLDSLTYHGPAIDDLVTFGRLTEELRQLLEWRNGFVAYGGGLHVRGVSISFYHGSRLPDPTHRLEGAGKQNRFVRVTNTPVLKEAAVRQLLRAAASDVSPPLPKTGRGKLVIKSVVAKRRSRRAV
jgi:hypothetical protein